MANKPVNDDKLLKIDNLSKVLITIIICVFMFSCSAVGIANKLGCH